MERDKAGSLTRRRLVRLAVAGAAGLLADGPGGLGTALGASQVARRTRTLTFWNYGGVPGFVVWLQRRVKEFERLNPDVRVAIVAKDWNTQEADLVAALSAGATPDLCTMHANLVGRFARNGGLMNLDRFSDFATFRQIFLPAYLDQTSDRGRAYGLPVNALPFVLVGNRALLGNTAMPRTWADFTRQAKARTRPASKTYGFAYCGGANLDAAYRFAAWVFTSGGRILSPDGKEPAFNGPGGVAALGMLVDLHRRGAMPPGAAGWTDGDSITAFARNQVAFDGEGPWIQDALLSSGGNLHTLVVAPLPFASPPVEGGRPATLIDMVMMGIWNRTTAPNEAWALLKFLRDEAADRAFTSGTLGGLPVVKSAYAPGVAWGLVGKNAFQQAAQSVQPWPAVTAIGLVQTELGRAAHAALRARQETK